MILAHAALLVQSASCLPLSMLSGELSSFSRRVKKPRSPGEARERPSSMTSLPASAEVRMVGSPRRRSTGSKGRKTKVWTRAFEIGAFLRTAQESGMVPGLMATAVMFLSFGS